MTATEKENGKKDTNNGNTAKMSVHNGAKPAEDASETAEAKNSSSASSKRRRRQSTRSVKAPTPFSPPMGGIKGISATAKKALASSSSGNKKASTSSVTSGSPIRRQFVPILYDLIEDTHNENPNIISWSRDGKSFTIHADHKDLDETIRQYFSHGRLRSLQRQLNIYGFVMNVNVYSHPQFHRGMDEEDLLAILRVKTGSEMDPEEEVESERKRKLSVRDRSESTSKAVKMPRRNSTGSSKTNDGDDVSMESVISFAQTVHNMLEECKDSSIMRWAVGGKAFILEPDHPGLGAVLEKYFHHRNFWSLKRQLNQYGWTKPQEGVYKGTLFNPAFHRNMPPENFDLIRRKDARNYIPLQKQLKIAKENEKKLKKAPGKKKKTKKADPNPRVPPVPADAMAVAKAVASAVATGPSNAGTKKKKVVKKAQRVKATVPKGKTLTTTKKKLSKTKHAPASARENAERLKKMKILSAEAAIARNRIQKNKQLQGLYESWTLFDMPAGLKSHIKRNSKKTWNVAAAAAGKEGLGAIKPEARYLICDEKMPDWLAKDDKETLQELEEMIIQDRRQRHTRQEAWSRKYSIAKGKTLPPSKFNRPTNKWKNVSPGDKIDVYWHDDNQYYTANVIKHQKGTSYFHLFYEEDGAMEWLDLSREDFKVIETQNRVQPTPSCASNGGATVGSTPKKDNRSLRTDSLSLPENNAHLAPFLRYSWNSLGLGNNLGTPAYNNFIKQRDPTAAAVSSLEILQDIRALRNRGFSAQADIDLRVDTKPNVAKNKSTTMLCDLQDEIAQDKDDVKSYQNFEATLSTVRKVTDHWGVPELIGNMQRLETRVATMDEREARVLERLRRKNLI